MNKHLLVITLSALISLSELVAMESPLDILIEAHEENAKTHMLQCVDSQEKSDELFHITRQMLNQHTKFYDNLQEAQQISPLLEALTFIILPTATAWQKETICLSEQLHIFLSTAGAMQRMFDETLDNAESNSNHIGAIALRRSLTKALAEKNKNYNLLRNNVLKQFENQILARCTRPISVNSINTEVAQLRNAEEKLLILVKLAHFYTNFDNANTEFVKISQRIQKMLRIQAEASKSTDTAQQVIAYCTQESSKFQKILLKENTNTLKAITSQLRQTKKKDLEKKLELLKAFNLDSIEEKARLITRLKKFPQFLLPDFLSAFEANIDKQKEMLTGLDNKAKDPKLKIEIVATQTKPICTIIDYSHIPISKHPITPCDLAQMKNNKTLYPYFIPFRLKQTLSHSNEQETSKLIYFCSKGSYLNQKEAQEQLYPTSAFLFTSGNKTHIIEEDTHTKSINESLWYHPNGQYYFINHTLPDTHAYQVDFVGALCFSKQQPTPSKI
jgi:hypothetical protein